MQVLANSLRIIEMLAKNQPIGVSELARLAEMPKSTVFRILQTLAECGWAESDRTSGSSWRLTSRLAQMAGVSLEGIDFRGVVRPLMMRLREITQETIHLAVLEGSRVIIVDRLDSPHLLRSSYPIGFQLPVHAASTGKAILSRLGVDEVEAILGDSDLEAFTPTTRRREDLLIEVAGIRSSGFAENHGEFRGDICSIAVPIQDRNGLPVGAISVSAPRERMSAERMSEVGRIMVEMSSSIVAP